MLIQDLHKKCNSKNNERINTHCFTDDCLYGYACVQCKYVQLTEENIKKHLDRDHQQINPNDDNFREITLLKSSSKLYMIDNGDSKLNKTLIDAKQNVSNLNTESSESNIFMTSINPGDSDSNSILGDDIPIDLTLSDDEEYV